MVLASRLGYLCESFIRDKKIREDPVSYIQCLSFRRGSASKAYEFYEQECASPMAGMQGESFI